MHFMVPPKAARWPICLITGRYAAQAICSIAVLYPHPRFRFTLTRCLDDDIRCDIIVVKRISAGGSRCYEIMILSKGYNIWPTGNVMPTPSFYGACLDDDIIMLSLGKQTYVHQAGSLFHSKTLVCLHGSQDFVCPQGSFLSPGSIFKGK